MKRMGTGLVWVLVVRLGLSRTVLLCKVWRRRA